MIDQLFCFFFCAKVITQQIQQPYAAKTEEVQQEEDEPLSTKLPKGAGTRNETQTKTLTGFVSGYSATYGGCLGCIPHYTDKGQLYYVTASGDWLDDSRFTIACTDDFALGSRLSLVNRDNGKSVAVICNDRGGFNTPKYNNRIADLTPAVQKALGTVTDKTLVEISQVPKVAGE